MVSLEELAVVKSNTLMETFGKDQLTSEILEAAVRSASEKRNIRFVFSSDSVSPSDVPLFPSTRGLIDLTNDVKSLLLTQYRLKPVKTPHPKPEPRRALTKTG